MMNVPQSTIWLTIIVLGLGTYLLRFSFLGLLGGRELPLLIRQLLNYTSVAVLPAIAAPMVFQSGEAGTDPIRVLAAGALLLVGVWSGNMMWALAVGLVIYFGGSWGVTLLPGFD